ncbi:hypothetical protein CUMW_137420 [Citrus unshiu]|uniref:Non-haem dioxygenase N-terminal domain-containing protein n=1 Tax=Citrus unshiu TaxID=55188 RepID=A0A2H5PHK9_CITUN|nr:hypothetical protein CUMW_137420 [Citrus unshiu]
MGEVDEAFVQALEHRPKLSVTEAEGIPLIDLSALSAANTNIKNPDSTIRDLVVDIGNACKNWGFFQVINHGVPSDKRRSLENMARKFFEQAVGGEEEGERDGREERYVKSMLNKWKNLHTVDGIMRPELGLHQDSFMASSKIKPPLLD